MRTLPAPGGARRRAVAAFTLVELLVSVALLTFLMLILVSITDSAGRAWREGQNRTEAFQSARTALEIVTRELTPAVVDTRMQFVVAPGTILTDAGATNVAPNSPAMLWMAPLGTDGGLCCVGYYLYRDDQRQFYRLKRIYIAPPDTAKPSPYFPQMVSASNSQDPSLRTSPVNADWFTRTWDANAFNEEDVANDRAVVSSAADGIVALWVQCLDILGKPVPLVSKSTVHPPSALDYNSAAYFQVATSTAFENGRSFLYLAQTPQSMKANRVPAAVDLTLITVDSGVLAKGFSIPQQTNVYDATGALDVDASTKAYTAALQQNRIFNARTFSTRVKLVNGN
ncbi:MAG: prepilin-type N-terminal cleavage/methylation domain-containing protein [Chthoniobacter sp.]